MKMKSNILTFLIIAVFLWFIWNLINFLVSGIITNLFYPVVSLTVLMILIFVAKGFFKTFYLIFAILILIQGIILIYTYQFASSYVNNTFYSNLGILVLFMIIYGYMLINRKNIQKRVG